MKREFSAGGIVFRKLKTDNRKPKTVWLISQHSHHKGWVFPKGLIGDTVDNELKEDTAVREVKEETGIDAEIVNDTPVITKYWYQFNKEKIFKTVYFYLMKHKGGNFKDHDHEMMDVKWATEEEVRSTITYANDRKAFEEALRLYNELT